MSISLDLDSFKKYKGNTEGFIVLQLLYEKRYDVLKIYLGLIEEPIISVLGSSLLNILEREEYIKIAGEDLTDIYYLEKTKDIFGGTVKFDEFWERYRNITGLPKHEKAIAIKFWNRLSKSEQNTAYETIEDYYLNRCSKFNNKPVPKKAQYYLEYKLWQNESLADSTDNISML